jgi:hypothetical protein
MFTLNHSAQAHPEVIYTDLEDEGAVLLHLESQTYFSLNVTGTCIWQAMNQGLSLQEISGRLQSTFQVSEEQANQSVLTLMGELAAHNLVQSPEG